MRPVNLIPPEERRDKRPIRTGPIAYLLVGALALALGGVTLVVLTNNKIADRKADITNLQQQVSEAKVRADQLAPFAQFKSVEEQRAATVRSLADSRFDWERVMRELALVMPSDVWLTDLSGAVSGSASSSSSTDTASAGAGSSISGPSLTMKGCAAGNDAVARFLSALRDIDGVTRVGLSSSERPSGSETGSTSASGSGSAANSDCRTRDFITQFEIVAAFDAVPTPQIPAAAPSTAASSTPTAAAGTSTESTPASATTAATPASP
jgi:Tfp pilus assembly protein PilN